MQPSVYIKAINILKKFTIDIQKILEKFKKEPLSPEETAALNNWFHSLHGAEKDFNDWIKEYGEEQLKEQLEQSFRKRLAKTNTSAKPLVKKIMTAAAVLLLTVSLLEILHLLIRKNQNNSQPITAKSAPAEQITDHKTAYIILSNGQKLVINKSAINTFNQGNVKVSNTATGQLTYSAPHAANRTVTEQYNTLVVPKGNEYQLILEDGTRVWLNSASELKYPVQFSANQRTVYLKGEAYFEVKHNAQIPFVVKTTNMTVTDIGTAFNIKSYPDETQTLATLIEGQIKVQNPKNVQNKIIAPGQQAIIQQNQSSISIQKADIDASIGWKNGYFIFNDQDIHSVMNVIGRWYNKDISLQLNKPVKIGGTFSKNENLEHLLKSIELIGNVHCSITNDKITITN